MGLWPLDAEHLRDPPTVCIGTKLSGVVLTNGGPGPTSGSVYSLSSNRFGKAGTCFNELPALQRLYSWDSKPRAPLPRGRALRQPGSP